MPWYLENHLAELQEPVYQTSSAASALPEFGIELVSESVLREGEGKNFRFKATLTGHIPVFCSPTFSFTGTVNNGEYFNTSDCEIRSEGPVNEIMQDYMSWQLQGLSHYRIGFTAPGTKYFNVIVKNDAIPETPSKYFTIIAVHPNASQPLYVPVGDPITCTIIDDDDWLITATGGGMIHEAGETETTVTISRIDNPANPGEASDTTYAIPVTVAFGGSAKRGADYTINGAAGSDTMTITIPVGQTSTTVKIKAKDDLMVERLYETIFVTATYATGVYPTDRTPVEIKVVDNDTLTLEKVKFEADLPMVADPGQTAWATDYDWVKNLPAKTNPVAYSNGNTTNKLQAKSEYSGAIEAGLTVEVRFIAKGMPGGDQKSGWIGVNGTTLKAGVANALKTFRQIYGGQKADALAQLQFEWEIRVGGDDNDIRKVNGVNTNPFYLTYGDSPGSGTLYHTVVHVGCVAAKGKTTVQTVFDAIWGKFSGDDICIKTVMMNDGAVIYNPNGKLYYYGIVDPSGATQLTVARLNGVGNTEGLLRHKDGSCGAWAWFLSDTLKAQGLSANVVNIAGQAGPFNRYGQTVTHQWLSADPDKGKHHGQKPLENRWVNHVIVEYNGSYYDSSYGVAYGAGEAGRTAIVHSLTFEYTVQGSTKTESRRGTEYDPNGPEKDRWINIQ